MTEHKDREKAIDLLGSKHYGNQWQSIKEGEDPTVDTVEAYDWMGEVVDEILALGSTKQLAPDKIFSIEALLVAIEEAKREERERIMSILQKEYPAIDTWQCWKVLKEG